MHVACCMLCTRFGAGEDALELPARLQRSIDAFTRKYEVLKAARTLDIKKQLGYVSVDIELDSGKTVR